MQGLMQQRPLVVSSLLTHAARHHAGTEIVSNTVEGGIHRYTYAEAERRARRLARVLQALGVEAEDRVGTLAWNGYRHFELYYAISGMGAVCHTINPRLFQDQIAYIVNHAEDRVLFVDLTFVTLVEALAPRLTGCLRSVVVMTDRDHMPDLSLPAGMTLLCYEDLMAAADEDYVWPDLDEHSACSLCYTSGTTGNPKGVLYSHRSTVLHSYAVNMADVFGLRATDRELPVVPMFHVNAWGIPYAAPMVGAALVFPGPHLDGASLQNLMETERVTAACGVPTVWLGLLQYLRTSGKRLDSVERLVVGGSACPPMIMEAFGEEYGVRVDHAWGMTELSPLGTYCRPTAATATLTGDAAARLRMKQGRAIYGVEMKIVGDDGRELPWDGEAFGDLMVRGSWVCSRYFGLPDDGTTHDADGWFRTGDVATIDPQGFMAITDRSKDVIKSGGEWISSIELENVAVAHPDVSEAAVIAALHSKWDERPLLIVTAKPGQAVDPDALLAFYAGKVAKWWIPDAVLVVDQLPHTATGKLQKLTLRDRYRNHLLSAAPAA